MNKLSRFYNVRLYNAGAWLSSAAVALLFFVVLLALVVLALGVGAVAGIATAIMKVNECRREWYENIRREEPGNITVWSSHE